MKPHRRLAAAAACSAGLAFTTISADPAAAEIIRVGPGAMYCNTGFVHVETPAPYVAGNWSGLDLYAPALQYLAPGANEWVTVEVGKLLTKERILGTWFDENGTPRTFHEFNVPNAQKGHYWRVLQAVRDGETMRTWDVYAVLKNHDPDYCDATGYWD